MPGDQEIAAEDYACYPAFIVMREFEVNGRILVTTLRDPQFVSTRALDELYKMRLSIEVGFPTIKSTSVPAWENGHGVLEQQCDV